MRRIEKDPSIVKNYSLNRETEPSHAPSTLVTREQKSRVFGARVGGLELMG